MHNGATPERSRPGSAILDGHETLDWDTEVVSERPSQLTSGQPVPLRRLGLPYELLRLTWEWANPFFYMDRGHSYMTLHKARTILVP